MINKSKLIVSVSCLIIMLATVLAYNLIFDHLIDVKMHWISLLYLLLSEAILLVKILLIHKQTIFSSAHITSSIIHIVLISIISALFLILAKENDKLFTLINVVIVSVLVVTDLLIYYAQTHTTQKANKQLATQGMISYYISQVQRLLRRHKGTSFYVDICKIEELLKYGDSTAITGNEETIGRLISELSILLDDKCADSARIYAKIDATTEALQERIAQTKVLKRGKY